MRTMRTRWTVRGLVAAFGWSVLAAGVAEADILPVATAFPHAVIANSPVTLAIRQGGVDKPGWLPEPGAAVELVVKVHGVEQTSGFSITLVPPASPVTFDGVTIPFLNASTATTSAYLGRCENSDNPPPMAPDAPDYELTGNTLTPTDCGGFAVLDVNVAGLGSFKFFAPQDSNANGIPDLWEQQFCTATFPCPTGREDLDAPPVTSTHFGDGIPVLGEYRGFMVRGAHVRTDPRQKDFFIFLVNPQCGATAAQSLMGGGTLTLPTEGDAFDGALQLFGAAQTHLLHTPGVSNYKSTEWVDHFVSYSTSTGLVLNPPGSPADRRMNKNAVLTATTGAVPKGLRVIECPAPLPGSPGFASPGAVNDNTGYAIIFPQRIVGLVNALVAGGGTRKLQHATYVGGRKGTPVLTGDGVPTNSANVNIWASLYLKYVVAQEVVHAGDVVSPGGSHTAEQTGYFTDITIYNKADKSTSGFNTTYFPSGPEAVSGDHKASFLLVP